MQCSPIGLYQTHVNWMICLIAGNIYVDSSGVGEGVGRYPHRVDKQAIYIFHLGRVWRSPHFTIRMERGNANLLNSHIVM